MYSSRCIECGVGKERIYLLEKKGLRCINCHISTYVPTKWVIETDFMREKGWHKKAGYDKNVWNLIADENVRKAAMEWTPESDITWPDGQIRPTFYD